MYKLHSIIMYNNIKLCITDMYNYIDLWLEPATVRAKLEQPPETTLWSRLESEHVAVGLSMADGTTRHKLDIPAGIVVVVVVMAPKPCAN